jgi:hypothetical protein
MLGAGAAAWAFQARGGQGARGDGKERRRQRARPAPQRTGGAAAANQAAAAARHCLPRQRACPAAASAGPTRGLGAAPPPPPYCSARLVPAVRETFSGHAEFDIVLEASSADKGDAVWQAVLTLVLMNPKKGKGHGGGDKKKVGGAGGLAASFLRLCRCLRRRAGGSRPGAGAKGRAGRRASCCGRHGAGAGAAKADATGE